jgi:hypothetical protein
VVKNSCFFNQFFFYFNSVPDFYNGSKKKIESISLQVFTISTIQFHAAPAAQADHFVTI